MISLIAAVARNRSIGKNGQLLWQIPEDMRYFRETTRGKAVIMGRKTWESLPAAFRPLPGRRNIVLTRDRDYRAAGADLRHTLDEALSLADNHEEIFVIGGEELYRQALPLAQRMYLTEVAESLDGDAFFPEFSKDDWQQVSCTKQRTASGLEFSFALYQRCPSV
jgi:dihydrofolate reductase